MRFRTLAGAAFYQQGRISYITWKSWYNYKNICERNYSLKDGDYPAARSIQTPDKRIKGRGYLALYPLLPQITNLVKVFSGELVKIDFLTDVSVALHFFKKFTNHPTACF